MEEQENEKQIVIQKKKWIVPYLEIIGRNSIESGSIGAPEGLDTFGYPLSDFQGLLS